MTSNPKSLTQRLLTQKIDNIKKIQGQFCRVERDLHNHNSIEQIGHIMEHRWLKVRTLEYEGNK